MQVTLVAKLVVARIASVPALRVARRFLRSTINTGQSPTGFALTRVVRQHRTANTRHGHERSVISRVQLEQLRMEIFQGPELLLLPKE